MGKIKNIAKRIPGIELVWRTYKKIRLKIFKTETTFTKIYRGNEWGGSDSVSGSGSDLIQTETIAKELPSLFKKMKILTMLDIPCGDFHWMKTVDLDGVEYIGADIVKDIITQNKAKYEKKNIHFHHLNLIKDDLPKVDLVFCRDCFVHFSFDDIFLALKNIYRSGSTYLLTTTFTEQSKNKNILTGEWRPLDFSKKPFNFPEPIAIINENCGEGNGLYADKSLALWRIKDLANI